MNSQLAPGHSLPWVFDKAVPPTKLSSMLANEKLENLSACSRTIAWHHNSSTPQHPQTSRPQGRLNFQGTLFKTFSKALKLRGYLRRNGSRPRVLTAVQKPTHASNSTSFHTSVRPGNNFSSLILPLAMTPRASKRSKAPAVRARS